MKIIRFLLGGGIIFITIKIGLRVNYILTGILLVIGLILLITSLKKKRK